MCRPKHVEQLRNFGIINSTIRLHLFGSFYEICITMHGSMNMKFILRNVCLTLCVIKAKSAILTRAKMGFQRQFSSENMNGWATCEMSYGREDNTERVLCEIAGEYMPWICLMKCKLQWRAFVVGCWIIMEAIPLCLFLNKRRFFCVKTEKKLFL